MHCAGQFKATSFDLILNSGLFGVSYRNGRKLGPDHLCIMIYSLAVSDCDAGYHCEENHVV